MVMQPVTKAFGFIAHSPKIAPLLLGLPSVLGGYVFAAIVTLAGFAAALLAAVGVHLWLELPLHNKLRQALKPRVVLPPAEAASAVDWFKPWDAVLTRRDGLDRWFAGAECNTAWNCLDRHVAAGHGGRVALIYDSPVTGVKQTYNYRALLEEVETFAAVLAGLVLVAIGTFFAQAVATGFVGRAATADRGSASGLYLASYFLGGLTGSIVLGQLFDRLGWTACVAGVALALLLGMGLAHRLEVPRSAAPLPARA